MLTDRLDARTKMLEKQLKDSAEQLRTLKKALSQERNLHTNTNLIDDLRSQVANLREQVRPFPRWRLLMLCFLLSKTSPCRTPSSCAFCVSHKQIQEARADPLSLLCEYNGLDTSDRLLSSKVAASMCIVRVVCV
jgi:septal ring factor EnvC (AmiA/AmiB activator)